MTNESRNSNHETRTTTHPSSFVLRPLFGLRICSFVILFFLALEQASYTEPLAISLVSEVTSIKPGVPFYVGLHLKHAPGYHTYWKFPGIVGVPTGIEWVPPLITTKAGAIEWPAPELVHMYQIKAQGFEGEVLLPVKITPPMDLVPETTFTLEGKTSWMCCGRECNPGFKDVSITLPVSRTVPGLDDKWRAAFEQARAAAAKPLAGWKAEAKRQGDVVTLTFTALSKEAKARAEVIKNVQFFTEDGFINIDKGQTFSKPASGQLELKLAVSQYAEHPAAKEMRGVLRCDEGWSSDGSVKSVRFRAPIIAR